MKSTEIEVVRVFIEAINAGDVERLAGLMTEDHTFIDSLGNAVTGAKTIKEGWRGFFQMFSDYRNHPEGFFQEGNTVMAYGSASGTYCGKRGPVAENHIEMPAAWKAVVEGGKIKEWRVYADWTEAHKVIERDNEAV